MYMYDQNSSFHQQNIPCQLNSYDCGIFSLEVGQQTSDAFRVFIKYHFQFARCLMLELPLQFTQAGLQYSCVVCDTIHASDSMSLRVE